MSPIQPQSTYNCKTIHNFVYLHQIRTSFHRKILIPPKKAGKSPFKVFPPPKLLSTNRAAARHARVALSPTHAHYSNHPIHTYTHKKPYKIKNKQKINWCRHKKNVFKSNFEQCLQNCQQRGLIFFSCGDFDFSSHVDPSLSQFKTKTVQ
ncbi:hypothetical protein B5X24_HaOG202477 [Helicoverpa armigera]|uniref:Uncharacterized protein n=1 Tax=Helicoverpa armigera TaxID=29058 RepID=A0A2W1BZS5_HELAM|nr:hypothetical protein B5X24_HaOG202477 [Helicoverpa armigera]